MLSVVTAILKAMRDLTHPRVLAVMLVPMLGSIIVWTAVAWYFWGAWTGVVASFFSDTAFARWMAGVGFTWMLQGLSAIAVIALVVAAALVTALVITELVVMPVILSVAGRQYPELDKEPSATLVGSMGNTAAGIAIFTALWLVTLPLWLTGVGAIVLPAVLSAYLNQRIFRYEALAEHAGRDEYRVIVQRAKGRLFALGLALAVVYYIPFVNLIAPVLSGLAFTHLCLGELVQHRRGGHTPAAMPARAR